MITVHGGDTVLWTGDSITARRWGEATGGLLDLLDAQMSRRVYGTAIGGSSAASIIHGGVSGIARGFFALNTGINGNKTADIAADVPGRITRYNPKVIILLIGVNDIAGRIPVATIQANYDSILSQIRAWSGTVQIGCVSILCYGEGWTGSANAPTWNNGVTDVDLETMNAYIRDTLCVTYSATYIDLRSPLLAIEPTINPGQSNNAFTIDGVHPIIQASEVTMGQWALPYFSVVP